MDAHFSQSLPSLNDLVAAISVQFIWFYRWIKVTHWALNKFSIKSNRNTCSEFSEQTLLNISGPPVWRNKLTWDLCIWPQSWSLTRCFCSIVWYWVILCDANLWGSEYLRQSKANWILYFFRLSLVTINYGRYLVFGRSYQVGSKQRRRTFGISPEDCYAREISRFVCNICLN